MSYDLDKNYPTEWKKRLGKLVSEPIIVGYFSVDEHGNYLPDSSSLMYWKPPTSSQVCLDLNKGIESAVRKAREGDGRIRHLLEWIKLNHTDIRATDDSESWIEPSFACSAGLLCTVMCHEKNNRGVGWIVCAAKWKGTIYMCRFRTSNDRETEAKIPQQEKFTSWGFKFEQYMLSANPSEDPDPSKPVLEPAEFRCLFRRRFGDHSVLFTAEMDGLDSKIALKDPLPLNELRFVELKTQRKIVHRNQLNFFAELKLRRWWAQSFLVDNAKIVCGFRDNEGIVSRLKDFALSEIVKMAQDFWNPVDCVTKCLEFLNLVAEAVVDDCDVTIYKFEQMPNAGIVTEELSPQSEYAFMPPSFLAATELFLH